ncbi:YwqI/YxiC family protein [Rummeliibacillus suwonensis]|uniref:YwqI/YxiC family protein n=1 Tax=Rummeliibacillus suwonensis TaxID=1306154 RepID=UPI0011B6612A|nr:YwqI/YxiC family protein [Rummeliibacillus suwonensis]
MSTEIKIKQTDIDQALSKMKSSTNTLHTSLPSAIGEDNVLTIIQKWKGLHQALGQVLESYKVLLIQNEETSRQAVQSMIELDEKLGDHHQMLK